VLNNVRFRGNADISRTFPSVRLCPKADMGGSGLPPCKLTPERHFSGRKSLM
jgi:hypothetical protein